MLKKLKAEHMKIKTKKLMTMKMLDRVERTIKKNLNADKAGKSKSKDSTRKLKHYIKIKRSKIFLLLFHKEKAT